MAKIVAAAAANTVADAALPAVAASALAASAAAASAAAASAAAASAVAASAAAASAAAASAAAASAAWANVDNPKTASASNSPTNQHEYRGKNEQANKLPPRTG